MTAGPKILSPEQAAERLIADIARPARLLVAVSGGSDSTGLLIALSNFISDGSGLSLFAATIDHALRPESADEARAVAALCGKLGIPHFIRRWEGEKPPTGVSAAAREARYRLLMDVADAIDATAIVTGHTIDDQAETIAMRAARNEGEENSGLAGMAQAVLLDRRRWLLRPFLGSRRADIRDFLTRQRQGWIDDPSNIDPHYERVRVRGQLEQESPFDTAAQALAAARRTALSDEAARLLREHVTIAHGVLAHIDPVGLQGDAAVRRHALSLLAAVLGGRAHALGSDSLDRVMAFLDGGQPGRITAGRVIFDRRRDGLYLVRENRGILPLHVPPGGTVIWDGRYRITNPASADIVVGPTAPDRDEALALFPDVPPAIAMRAVAAMPFIESNALLSTEDRQNKGVAERSIVQPLLAPFDRFLPQFELTLGIQFAVLLGCDVFPRLPVKDSSRKR
ncbi:tRNA(Ile)-lysidine synthase [Rhizobium sp. CF080]|uniref:tRNA lysidine(34) synthetase TilS n=1 Tax=Rhizobium sp. (strain CF080) TaxID=1144310 RepID=UPI0003E805AD|nr:tRNA lysidine(34) synthetase TilS [Rhizobium sp. CF080]EUB97215.1 tRNA(Ile)-lysidine synthase [Rhizobium sp. CF080]